MAAFFNACSELAFSAAAVCGALQGSLPQHPDCPKCAPRSAPPRRLQIGALPEWAQLAFAGYKALNRIQSRIYSCAFTSNENMLVCAPTGEACEGLACTVLRCVPGGPPACFRLK